jgi:S-(hydroxymethyl)glutathione dehydrogenase/alcohol dehydrogenase
MSAGQLPVRAAVFLGAGAGFRVEELVLDPPGPGEVRVRMLASGVCHSDLHVLDGDWERPAPVAGWGAGIEALDRASESAPGGRRPRRARLDGRCGACRACDRGDSVRRTRGWPPPGGGTPPAPAGRKDRGILGHGRWSTGPGREAALLGCAVTTGVGAATRTAGIRRGETVVVIGLGGVGLSAVMGAVLAGAARVVAVDRVPAKLELAREMGATDGVLAGDAPGTRGELLRLLPGGADHALEAIGLAATAELALDVVRPGGTVTLVGMTPQGVRAGVDVYAFVERGIRLLGSNYGSAVPAEVFPDLAGLAVAGRLPVGRLVEERIGLDDLAPAFEALRRGDGARRVVVFDPPA